MITIQVDTTSAATTLIRATGQIDATMRQNVQAGLSDLITALKSEVQQRTPSSGASTLRNEMASEVRWEGLDLVGVVNNPLIYARPIELGRTSRKMPPSDALRAWAQRKLGDANLAFVVARAIGKRGFTHVQPYGDRAQMFQDAFEQNTGLIERELNKIGLNVTEAVRYLFNG